MRRWGAKSKRVDRPLSFYPIYVKDNEIVRIGEIPGDSFHPNGRNIQKDDGEVEIWPIDQNEVERRWNFGLDTIEDNLDRVVIEEVDDTLDLFVSHERKVPKTIWDGGKYDAGNYGNTLLIDILGEKRFDFPKSINLVERCIYLTTETDRDTIVLDYFAGSGTTGHAVVRLNREGNKDKNRKYIMVEMGEYFDSVTKPRVQKVVYSKEWKDGKPVDREGISHCFKYLRLESYEDTLNNLNLKRSGKQQDLIEDEDLREEYMLHYMLDVETRDRLLSTEMFKKPFGYTLEATEHNERKKRKSIWWKRSTISLD